MAARAFLQRQPLGVFVLPYCSRLLHLQRHRRTSPINPPQKPRRDERRGWAPSDALDRSWSRAHQLAPPARRAGERGVSHRQVSHRRTGVSCRQVPHRRVCQPASAARAGRGRAGRTWLAISLCRDLIASLASQTAFAPGLSRLRPSRPSSAAALPGGAAPSGAAPSSSARSNRRFMRTAWSAESFSRLQEPPKNAPLQPQSHGGTAQVWMDLCLSVRLHPGTHSPLDRTLHEVSPQARLTASLWDLSVRDGKPEHRGRAPGAACQARARDRTYLCACQDRAAALHTFH
jgi:hypothetical protein